MDCLPECLLLHESPITLIDVNGVHANVGNQQIRKPILIEIARTYSLTEIPVSDQSNISNILKTLL